jgi:hypothetical protein
MKDTFEIQFDNDYYDKGDSIDTVSTRLIVVSTPKRHYDKWYWKILNKLTFRKFFNASYSYKVKEQS